MQIRSRLWVRDLGYFGARFVPDLYDLDDVLVEIMFGERDLRDTALAHGRSCFAEWDLYGTALAQHLSVIILGSISRSWSRS